MLRLYFCLIYEEKKAPPPLFFQASPYYLKFRHEAFTLSFIYLKEQLIGRTYLRTQEKIRVLETGILENLTLCNLTKRLGKKS